jgi:hypothetical protein
MSDFKIVDLKTLPKATQQRILRTVVDKVYKKSLIFSFEGWVKHLLKHYEMACMVKGRKVFGAAAFVCGGGQLQPGAIWAEPNMEFWKKEKKSIAQALNEHRERVAKQRGLKFSKDTTIVGAGEIFDARMKGKRATVAQLLKRREQLRRTRTVKKSTKKKTTRKRVK